MLLRVPCTNLIEEFCCPLFEKPDCFPKNPGDEEKNHSLFLTPAFPQRTGENFLRHYLGKLSAQKMELLDKRNLNEMRRNPCDSEIQ